MVLARGRALAVAAILGNAAAGLALVRMHSDSWDAYALQDAGLDTYAANTALGPPEDARDYTARLRC